MLKKLDELGKKLGKFKRLVGILIILLIVGFTVYMFSQITGSYAVEANMNMSGALQSRPAVQDESWKPLLLMGSIFLGIVAAATLTRRRP